MKATELRIGNLVLYKQIEVQWSIEDFAELPYGIENLLKPIPLTEEWLVKFGFNCRGMSYGCLLYSMPFIYLTERIGCWELEIGGHNNHLEIKYVHQLQNLYFALTGKELEINLNK